MYIDEKKSSDKGQFWVIVFENKAEKREFLNMLRMVDSHLSDNGKQQLYALIRNISSRCEHDATSQNEDEITSYIFPSDIEDIILFAFLFSNIVLDVTNVNTELRDDNTSLCNAYEFLGDTIDEYNAKLDKYENIIADHKLAL